MGKHIKTQMDYNIINDLAEEVGRLDPENKKLNKYLTMENFEGGELRKHIKQFPWADKVPGVTGR
jgi:hypothetical protein|tara:strand:+ start:1238 stop:1432 length:195 start_codon:yes stop_codon:yes gene_type:complete